MPQGVQTLWSFEFRIVFIALYANTILALVSNVFSARLGEWNCSRLPWNSVEDDLWTIACGSGGSPEATAFVLLPYIEVAVFVTTQRSYTHIGIQKRLSASSSDESEDTYQCFVIHSWTINLCALSRFLIVILSKYLLQPSPSTLGAMIYSNSTTILLASQQTAEPSHDANVV